MYILKP